MTNLYVIKQNNVYALVKANHKPVHFVTDKIPADIDDIEVLDIVDDIDPDTLELIGKKAVFNQAKFDVKQQLMADKLTAEQVASSLEVSEKATVDSIDVDLMLDNMDKAKLKQVLKWLIKRAR